MKFKSLGLLILVVFGIQACAELGAPQVFSDLKFKEAKQASLDQEVFLLVDATAVWCGPCKLMESTTWVDSRVESWIQEHAIAIQLDVDLDEDDARMLMIEAMPTIIMFKDGEEFNRFIGYKDADELLAWLDGILEVPVEGEDEEGGLEG